jgi:hypothetical protein
MSKWATVTLTNAKSAQKMIQTNTGLKILKKSVHTTGIEAKSQSVSRRTRKLRGYGAQKTKGEVAHIMLFQTPYGVEIWSDYRASDAEKKSPSLIMKTMTNLLKLCGFANHATSKDIKS